MSIITIELPEM